MVRLDRDDNGRYSHTKEECVADLMSEYLSGTPVYYALAGYNNILPVLNPATKEPAYLMGFECWVGGRQFPCWQGNERGGFYAGAMYAIRDKNAQYWLNEVNGPATVEKSPLQSVRSVRSLSRLSPKNGKVIYFGGFVADHGPSHNTAWVYKTSIENALRKDAPRPSSSNVGAKQRSTRGTTTALPLRVSRQEASVHHPDPWGVCPGKSDWRQCVPCQESIQHAFN